LKVEQMMPMKEELECGKVKTRWWDVLVES